MDDVTRNELIARLLAEDHSLSDVQKVLEREHGLKITYMELRLIASDLQVNWGEVDEKAAAAPTPEDDLLAEPGDEGGAGTTRVSVSKVVRPGSLFSGTVDFASGAKAEWWLDQLGRLGLNPLGDSEKPTESDLQEFQVELQRSLQGQM